MKARVIVEELEGFMILDFFFKGRFQWQKFPTTYSLCKDCDDPQITISRFENQTYGNTEKKTLVLKYW